jgi:RimJ/RimL family protein N-acetyltransferase
MTELIFSRDEELAQWAEEVYPDCAPLARPLTAIGVASSEGALLAVAIYHNFRYHDIEITFVTSTPSRWATKATVRSLLHYPFYQLGVKRMSAITKKSNKKARNLLEAFGFRLEGVHPFADNGTGAACSYGLYRDNAISKWFPEVELANG